MKKLNLLIVLGISCFAKTIFAQGNPPGKMLFPFLEPESQSNIVVTFSDYFGTGQPCPLEWTNSLANTNLFTAQQRELLKDLPVKYKDVSTNSGPLGTVFVASYETNYMVKRYNLNVNVKETISTFHYTNQNASETIYLDEIGKVRHAQHKDASNNGYGIVFTPTGSGTMVSFGQMKNDKADGIAVRFEDTRPQGTNWNYKKADFDNMRLTEYKQYTNGLVFGKYLLWSARNNNLMLEAEFKEPYDMEAHRTDIIMAH